MKPLASQIITNSIHPTTINWAHRVVKNGGATPSYKTIRSLSRFCNQLDKDNLTSRMYSCCCFVPDNLIASITPLIRGIGYEVWTNLGGNFVEADLTIAGLKGNASNKRLDTGIKPANVYSIGRGGMSLYVTDMGAGVSSRDIGCTNNYAPAHVLHVNLSNQDYWTLDGNNQFNGAVNGFLGLHVGSSYSGGQSIYKANSTTPVTVVATTDPTEAADYGWADFTMYVFQDNGASTVYPSDKRYSWAGFHDGFKAGDTTKLHNAIQQMRQDLGGGWV